MTSTTTSDVITFVIPVRDHRGVADWPTMSAHLATTVASITAQTSPNWRCVLVATQDTPASGTTRGHRRAGGRRGISIFPTGTPTSTPGCARSARTRVCVSSPERGTRTLRDTSWSSTTTMP